MTPPMRRYLLLLTCLCVPVLVAAAPARDAHAILAKLDDLWRGTSSRAVMTMRVRTVHWERTLTMQAYSQGKANSLVKVLTPLKERGTATLKVGTEIYNYLPKTDRTIKLTAAMMMGAWMGSHFTNDDLVKESRMAEDYTAAITFSGLRDGLEITEMTLKPKPEAAVVWGRIVAVVRAADDQPVKITYYDEDGAAVRVMSFADYKTIAGRLLPLRLTMTPLDKPGEFTEVVYNELAFDVALPPDFFSLSSLRR